MFTPREGFRYWRLFVLTSSREREMWKLGRGSHGKPLFLWRNTHTNRKWAKQFFVFEFWLLQYSDCLYVYHKTKALVVSGSSFVVYKVYFIETSNLKKNRKKSLATKGKYFFIGCQFIQTEKQSHKKIKTWLYVYVGFIVTCYFVCRGLKKLWKPLIFKKKSMSNHKVKNSLRKSVFDMGF